jgi:hypothetical protein
MLALVDYYNLCCSCKNVVICYEHLQVPTSGYDTNIKEITSSRDDVFTVCLIVAHNDYQGLKVAVLT